MERSIYLKWCPVRGYNANRSRDADVKSQENEKADDIKLELSRDLPHESCRIRRSNIGQNCMQGNCSAKGEKGVCRVHETLFFVPLSGENSEPEIERGYKDKTSYGALICGRTTVQQEL